MSDIDRKIEELNVQRAEAASKKDMAEKKIISLRNAKKKKSKKSKVKNQASEDSESTSCKICFEPFDKNDHHQCCITKCFHTFCYSCLNSLKPKKCPSCREPFRMAEVRKLF